MSNPAQSLASLLAEHIDPAYAALGGVIGMGVGMVLIVLAGIATARLMETRNERKGY